MTDHAYLKWPSDRGRWHVLVRVDDMGWHLRCGKVITTETAPAAARIPVDDAACESCAAMTAGDEPEADVA